MSESSAMAALLGLLAALVLMPISRKVAARAGVVDRPGQLKLQGNPVPLLGGVALLLALIAGLLAGVLVGTAAPPDGWIPIAAGALWVLAVGLTDDLRKPRGGLGARAKFCGQVLAALLLCSERIHAITGGSDAGPDWLALAWLLFLVLAVINAVNLVDNMNGLASGLALISAVACLLGGGLEWAEGNRLLAAALVGALLGFLPFNFPRARSYLGDAGSYLIGYLLALLALELSNGFLEDSRRPIGPLDCLPALLLVGLPLFDLGFSVVRRIRERRPVFSGDTRHLSHRLVGAGMTPARAVLLLWMIQLVLVTAGWFCLRLGPAEKVLLTGSLVLLLSILAALLVLLERRHRGLRGLAGSARDLSPDEFRARPGPQPPDRPDRTDREEC